MKEFNINKDLNIVCKTTNTYGGFKHIATLYRNDERLTSTSVTYMNRTWESYEYETVITNLLRKTNHLTEIQKKRFLNKQKRIVKERVDSMSRTTATVALMGEFFEKDKKGQNDWKLRMLKAGIKDLNVPSDWDKLSESQKEERLNKVIKLARGDMK